MPITVVCACGKKLGVPENLAGKRVKCPVCEKPVAVPAHGAPTKSTPKPTTKTGSSSQRAVRLEPCSRCRDSFPPDTLTKLRGQMICKNCKEEALLERPSTQEKNRNLLLWSGIAGGVGLVIVIGLGVFLAVRMAGKPGPKPKTSASDLDLAALLDTKPATPPPASTASAKGPAKATTQPVKSPPDPALANLRALRHEPKTGERWGFHLDIILSAPDAKEPMAGNRITGDLDLTQKTVGPDQQSLALVFRRLEVAKPFTDDEYRGAEAFPKNVVGKEMTLLLGSKKGTEKPPDTWPATLPHVASTGDEIKHDDDTKDPAGLAFKNYLTPPASDLLAQAFLFLGRDMLPKELGNPPTWEVSSPYLLECDAYAPVTYTLSRKVALAPNIAVIDIKSKSEYEHKVEGKTQARLKLVGSGAWKYNLDDSTTDSLSYNAKIEEEAVENKTTNVYHLRIVLTRHKIDPRELALADKPKPPVSDAPAKKPEETKKPDDPKKPAGTPPPGAAKPDEKEMKNDKKDKPVDKPKPDANPPKEPAKPEAGVDAEKEKLAQAKLNQAKKFLDIDKTNDAIDYCEEIIKKWPGTKAAEEAAGLLKKLKK